MFACNHERVSPDLMALSKGITGGYLPLAATLTTNEIYGAFLGGVEDLKTFYHGHSYTGNPLACSAAIASLDLFKKEKVLEALQPKIRLLSQELEKFYSFPNVGDIRQKGLMVGIELVKDREKKNRFSIEGSNRASSYFGGPTEGSHYSSSGRRDRSHATPFYNRTRAKKK